MSEVLQHICAAIPLVLQPDVILFMFLGTAIGIAIGALPGLSATMGIAVLIPLTFVDAAADALGMIAGIYNGAMYGGAIPAILLRIPGTPAGIATVFDGYPMAQQGRAQTRAPHRARLVVARQRRQRAGAAAARAAAGGHLAAASAPASTSGWRSSA